MFGLVRLELDARLSHLAGMLVAASGPGLSKKLCEARHLHRC